MQSSRRLPFHLPTLGLIALLVAVFVVAGCGTTTTTGTAGTGGAAPTATTAPTVAPTNTIPAPTNTPSGSHASVSITSSGYYGNFAFSPSSLSIKVGTTVTWTNGTTVPHTVTSDAGDPATFNGSLGSHGATFSFTFMTPGTYQYHCSIHPYMKATITVTM
jgi:plastocyanin